MTAEAALARRSELEQLLRGPDASRNVGFAINLALEHGWNVERQPGLTCFNAIYRTRTIRTPTALVTDGDVASFCHEGGHIEDPQKASRRRSSRSQTEYFDSVAGECAAWIWAIKALGRRWNRAMQSHLQECLRSYISINDSYEDLLMNEATIAYGAEVAKQLIRIYPMPIPSPIAQLVKEIHGA